MFHISMYIYIYYIEKDNRHPLEVHTQVFVLSYFSIAIVDEVWYFLFIFNVYITIYAIYNILSLFYSSFKILYFHEYSSCGNLKILI